MANIINIIPAKHHTISVYTSYTHTASLAENKIKYRSNTEDKIDIFS